MNKKESSKTNPRDSGAETANQLINLLNNKVNIKPIEEEKIDLTDLSEKEEEEFQKPKVKMPFYGARFMMASESTPIPQA